MKDGVNFKAKHIIFKEGFYYITAIENTKGKAVIYKSADLISYEEITIKTGTSTNVYPVHGIFLKSTGEIVIIFNETTTDTSKYSGVKYLLILNSLIDYNEEDARFIEITGNNMRIMSYYANSTRMKKDRIYTYTAGSITSPGTVRIVITMDGNSTSYSELLEKIKTKRYTLSRIRRILLFAYLSSFFIVFGKNDISENPVCLKEP